MSRGASPSKEKPQDYVARVLVSEQADELRFFHGELMFHQRGYDGSSPMCYSADEFNIGDCDIYLW